jgi:hypothetical protein
MDNNQRRRLYHRIPDFFKGVPRRARSYWGKLMDSTQNKLSRGASFISRVIPFARHDNWRRNDKNQHR